MSRRQEEPKRIEKIESRRGNVAWDRTFPNHQWRRWAYWEIHYWEERDGEDI